MLFRCFRNRIVSNRTSWLGLSSATTASTPAVLQQPPPLWCTSQRHASAVIDAVGKNTSKLLSDRHPSLHAELHADLNPNIDLATLTVDSGHRLVWKCGQCSHTWKKSVLERAFLNRDCPHCHEAQNPRLSMHPDIAREWCPERNPRNTHPKNMSSTSARRLWWRCGKCKHQWEDRVKDRAAGKGCCPRCDPTLGKWAVEHPVLAQEWHPLRNGDLKPQSCTERLARSVWWLCSSCGFEFEHKIAGRCAGEGCPSCSNDSKE
eukprot:PhM_4_TR2660/c0_g1_i2/m.71700